jgi:hypothetical protein
VITILPPRDQTAVGAKLTLITHDDPTVTGEVQLLVCEKSPVAMTLLMVRLAVPVLLTVSARGALLAPTAVPGKLRPTEDNAAIGAIPVPLMGAVCGLPDALSLIFTFDERLPVLVGLNVTLIVQLALAASDAGQVLVSEKSTVLPPDNTMPVTDNDAVPVLVSVITCAVLAMPTC